MLAEYCKSRMGRSFTGSSVCTHGEFLQDSQLVYENSCRGSGFLIADVYHHAAVRVKAI
jgi:hypothetical protein